MLEKVKGKPSKTRLIDQITGINPAIPVKQVPIETEGLALDLHGLIQNEDRHDTHGSLGALEAEFNFRGEVDSYDSDDLQVQQACNVVSGNGSALNALIASPWRSVGAEEGNFTIRNRATFVLDERVNRLNSKPQ